MEQRAAIIGSGIAGIACALRLRRKGYSVEVFEANSYVGGKLTSISQNGYRWDAGPSLFTMPHFVDELFEIYNTDPKHYFNYKRKATACHYFWEDGSFFKAKADPEAFAREASRTFNTEESLISDYLRRAKEKYDLTAGLFLEKSLHKWSTYLSWETISSLAQSYKLDISQTLNQVNESQLGEPHLVQLFNRYATYNGSSPFKTPGIMSMIPHLEMHYGTFLPEGGMHAITMSLYEFAREQGIVFHLDSPVQRINTDKHTARGIRVNDVNLDYDLVVSNMDIFSTYKHLLKGHKGPKHVINQERSSSALIFYWGIAREFPNLDLHNIFFTSNYEEEFHAIFHDKTLSDDPTVYINITSKDEPGDAPEGCENWFVMVNAPGNHNQDWPALIDRARENILAKLSRLLKVDIAPLISTEDILDPVNIESRTSSHQGSLYGASSNNRFAAFLRHANFSSRFNNLFFCGGSVHPGGGIPLCLLSAKIVSDLTPRP